MAVFLPLTATDIENSHWDQPVTAGCPGSDRLQSKIPIARLGAPGRARSLFIPLAISPPLPTADTSP